MPRLDAVVTGGGTSGHVLPAIAVLESLEDAGMTATRLGYVGCRRGVERSLFRALPYPARYLPIAGLQRSRDLSSLRRNAALPFRVVASYIAAVALAVRWRPRVVVSVGGYASAPMAFASRVLRIPLVCVSYDAIPGLATRRQARHAAFSAAAFPDSPLPRARLTGAPVRRAIRHIDVGAQRDTARTELDVPRGHVLVTVMGGSQGSAVLNDAVVGLLGLLADSKKPVAVLHICGERFESAPQPEVPTSVWYRRVGYEERMAAVLAATDVLVCRAGAGTIGEIATVGVAAVIVPWKDSADDHQRRNAAWLADVDAAVVLDEVGLDSVVLARTVVSLVNDDDARRRLADAARARGSLNRSGTLAAAVVSALS